MSSSKIRMLVLSGLLLVSFCLILIFSNVSDSDYPSGNPLYADTPDTIVTQIANPSLPNENPTRSITIRNNASNPNTYDMTGSGPISGGNNITLATVINNLSSAESSAGRRVITLGSGTTPLKLPANTSFSLEYQSNYPHIISGSIEGSIAGTTNKNGIIHFGDTLSTYSDPTVWFNNLTVTNTASGSEAVAVSFAGNRSLNILGNTTIKCTGITSGPAIRFNSSGQLVINTTGEISSYNANTNNLAGTISVAGSRTAGTRLSVNSATVNNYSNTGGYCFYLTAPVNASAKARDILAGGTYSSTGGILLTPENGTLCPHITVGNTSTVSNEPRTYANVNPGNNQPLGSNNGQPAFNIQGNGGNGSDIVFQRGTFVNNSANVLKSEGTATHKIFIQGGSYTGSNAFIVHNNSNMNIYMTNDNVPTFLSGSLSIASVSTSGSGSGTVYLNGGSITRNSTGSSRAPLINVSNVYTDTKVSGTGAGATKSVVSGLNSDGTKSAAVTRLSNFSSGDMQMIKITSGSNAVVIIDRLDWRALTGGTPITSKTLVAEVASKEDFPTAKNDFPSFVFTGTLAGLIGGIKAYINVIELGTEFNDTGYSGTKYSLEVPYINDEVSINGTVIANFKGNGITGTASAPNWYKDHFLLDTNISESVSNPPSGIDKDDGYDDHGADSSTDDWQMYNTLNISWYSEIGIEPNEMVSALGNPKNNKTDYLNEVLPLENNFVYTENVRSTAGYQLPHVGLNVEGFVLEGWYFYGRLSPSGDEEFYADGGLKVEEGMELYSFFDHILVAKWVMAPPDLSNITPDVIRDYDENSEDTLTLTASHDYEAKADFSYEYKWEKSVSLTGPWTESSGTTESTYVVKNVADSGYYRLSVRAFDNTYESGWASHIFKVDIKPKDLSNIAYVDGGDWDQEYDGSAKTPGTYSLTDGNHIFGYTLTYSVPQPHIGSSTAVTSYTYIFNFNTSSDGNYTGSINKDLVIRYKITVTFTNTFENTVANMDFPAGDTYENLPTGLTATGYTFMGWEYNGMPVENGDTLQSDANHTLTARWKLVLSNSQLINPTADVSKIYDYESETLTLDVSGASSVTYQYRWEKATTASGPWVLMSGINTKSINVRNVSESGYYRLTVRAVSGDYTSDWSVSGWDESPSHIFHVAITRRNLTSAAEILGGNWDQNYDGAAKTPGSYFVADGSHNLVSGTDYTLTYSAPLPHLGNASATTNYVYTFNFGNVANGNFSGSITKSFIVRGVVVVSFGNTKGTMVSAINYLTGGTYTSLPVGPEAAGYNFEGWEYRLSGSSVIVNVNDELKLNTAHTLYARWSLIQTGSESSLTLNAPDIGSSTTPVIYRVSDFVTTATITAQTGVTLAHASTFIYSWKKSGTEVTNASFLSVKNVSDTGTYTLTVTGTDIDGVPFSLTKTVNVYINPKAMTSGSITGNWLTIYNGNSQEPDYSSLSYNGEILKQGAVVGDGNDFLVTLISEKPYINEGTYVYEFTFYGNYSGTAVRKDFIIQQNTSLHINLTNTKGTSVPEYLLPVNGKYPDTLPSVAEMNSTYAVSGYTFLYWEYDTEDIVSGDTLLSSSSHDLIAVWEFKEDTELSIYVTAPDISTTYSYEGAQTGFTSTASISIPNASLSSVTYKWTLKDDTVTVSSLDTLSLNQATTGIIYYTVTITGVDSDGLSFATAKDVSVNIIPKTILVNDFILEAKAATGTAQKPDITIKDDLYSLVYGTSSDYYITNNDYDSMIDAGEYDLEFIFRGNYQGQFTKKFMITAYTGTKIYFANLKVVSLDDLNINDINTDGYAIPDSGTYGNIPDVSFMNGLSHAGYSFVKWIDADGTVITPDMELISEDDHVLYAVWEFIPFTFSDVKDDVSKIYDGTTKVIGYTASHDAAGDSGVKIVYQWYKDSIIIDGAVSNALNVRNVSDSGTYRLTVTISDGDISHDESKDFIVSITVIEIDVDPADDFDDPTGDLYIAGDWLKAWNGNIRTATNIKIYYLQELLTPGTDYLITRPTSGSDAGVYTYTFTFIGDYESSSDPSKDFEIRMEIEITLDELNGLVVNDILNVSYPLVPTNDGKYQNLPGNDIMAVAGFEFLGWKNESGDYVENTESLPSNLRISQTLYAQWSIIAPGVDIKENGSSLLDGDDYTFAHSYTGNEYTISAVLTELSGIDYEYIWKKSGSAAIISNTKDLIVTDVMDSGLYTISIILRSPYTVALELPVKNLSVTIDIIEIDIDPDDDFDDPSGDLYIAGDWEKSWNGDIQTATNIQVYYLQELLTSGIDYQITMPVAGSNAGIYTYTFTFIGSYESSSDPTKDFEIKMETEITLDGLNGLILDDILNGATYPLLPTNDGKYQNLPDLDGLVAGYVFNGWFYGEKEAKNTESIIYTGDHTLIASWSLDDPDFTYSGDITKEYNGSVSALSVTATHASSDITFTYQWYFGKDGSYIMLAGATQKLHNVLNVTDSGQYFVRTTVFENSVLKYYTDSPAFNVAISRKALSGVNLSDITPNDYTGVANNRPSVYDSFAYDGDLELVYGTDYRILTVNGINYQNGNEFKDMQNYLIVFEFLGNYSGRASKTYTINTIIITLFDNKNKTETEVFATKDGKYPALDLPARDGYIILGWQYGSDTNYVLGGQTLRLFADHELTALWGLMMPEISVDVKEIDGDYGIVYNSVVTVDEVGIDDGLEYHYQWLKNGVVMFIGKELSVANVSENGTYILRVWTKEGDSTSPVATETVTVEIHPKKISDSDIEISDKTYNGAPQTPVITVNAPGTKNPLIYGFDYTVSNYGTEYTDVSPDARGYEITIILPVNGNYVSDDDMYSLVQYFKILPLSLTLSNQKNRGDETSTIYISTNGLYQNLPTAEEMNSRGVAGYTFTGWYWDNIVFVNNGSAIREFKNHQLEARWELNEFTISGISDVTGEFNGNPYTLTITASSVADVTYTYSWERMRDGNIIVEETNMVNEIVFSLVHVNDSGYYRLKITATDSEGISITMVKEVIFDITPTEITKDHLNMPSQVYTGTGIKANATITFGDIILVYGTDYQMSEPADHDYKDVGAYEIEFEFMGDYKGRFTAVFEITPSDQVMPAWMIWVIVSSSAIVLGGTLWGIFAYIRYKRKKYGMKRHMHSFMDDFDTMD